MIFIKSSYIAIIAIVWATLSNGCSTAAVEKSIVNKQLAAQARLNLGLYYLETNQILLAYQNIEQALCHEPNSYRVQLAMALYQQRVGKIDKAEMYYKKSLRLAPDAGEVLNSYGIFLCKLQRYSEAQLKFIKAMNGAGYLNIADGLQNSALCYLYSAQEKQAKKLLLRADKLYPDRTVRLLSLATQEFQNKQFRRASWLLSMYDTLQPANSSSIWLHMRLAKLNKNLPVFKKYGVHLSKNFTSLPNTKKF